MSGQEYDSIKGLRPARKLGTQCTSNACLKSKNRHCQLFSDGARQRIFEDFWKTGDWASRKAMVGSLVDRIQPKQRRGQKDQFRRSDSFLYYLKLEGAKHLVCRNMFMTTLSIKEKQLRGWLRKSQNSKAQAGRRSGEKNLSGHNFLEMLPKLPSHYCRQSSTKMYLEPTFQTKQELYRQYKEFCSGSQNKPISWSSFHQLMEKKNISLCSPKKDKCDICCSHETGKLNDNLWKAHIEKKEIARAEKQRDKLEAFKGNIHCVCVDMQAVKLCPMLNASSLYYKTKLIVHNYTVYDMATRDAKCYL